MPPLLCQCNVCMMVVMTVQVALYGSRDARDIIKQYELYADPPAISNHRKRSREDLQVLAVWLCTEFLMY